MTTYRSLNADSYDLISGYSLIPIRKEDMALIRLWRNEQMDILRQKSSISESEQRSYYNDVIEPQFHLQFPEQILFSLVDKEVCIGYGGLTHIDWSKQSAEISFLLETSKNDDQNFFKEIFAIFLNRMKLIAFTQLKLKKLEAETYDIRPYVVDVLEMNGFILNKRLKNGIKIGQGYKDILFHGCLNTVGLK